MSEGTTADRKTRLGRVVHVAGGYTVGEVLEDREDGVQVLEYSVFGRGLSGLMIHNTVTEAIEILERLG